VIVPYNTGIRDIHVGQSGFRDTIRMPGAAPSLRDSYFNFAA
jgi:hypothetical protein